MIIEMVISTIIVTEAAIESNSVMVGDLSYSFQSEIPVYLKIGASIVTDYSENNGGIYLYLHIGIGLGYCKGITYSVGKVINFNDPEDYSRFFIDINLGGTCSFDHCFNPGKSILTTTKADSISFSPGINYGIGLDYYSNPIPIRMW